MFYLFKTFTQMKILLNKTSLTKSLGPFNDIGFVPTMGSIHKGHLSLINKSNQVCNKTIVSIFVNPKQFNNKKDFKTYPKNMKKDLQLLNKTKQVDFIYIPKFKDIFNNNKKPKIKINKKDKILCAKFRKGHFEGVLDVMERLTNIVKPNKIFMGEKDFQQLFLVKKFLKNKYGTEVIGCKTIRKKNKVALSSRNYLLSKENVALASVIIRKLINLKKNIKFKKNKNRYLKTVKNELEKKFNINIEYLELRNIYNLKLSSVINKSRLFVAYYLNGVRLIDNL
ncbi:pantoate--beta-alanine ligase [Pelagibacterales bacterium SAG-MED08]|nr:pantoate--beta-alanine ligase [Pelagibacterales bacterium SAG-MED08]